MTAEYELWKACKRFLSFLINNALIFVDKIVDLLVSCDAVFIVSIIVFVDLKQVKIYVTLAFFTLIL